MGLLGYYLRYIENFSRVAKPIYDDNENFSRVAKPMYDLLKYDSECPSGKKQQLKEKCRPKKKNHQFNSSFFVRRTPECFELPHCLPY